MEKEREGIPPAMEPTEENTGSGTPEMMRRDFLKRFGVYAAGSAAGIYMLMSAKTSKATGSDGAP